MYTYLYIQVLSLESQIIEARLRLEATQMEAALLGEYMCVCVYVSVYLCICAAG